MKDEKQKDGTRRAAPAAGSSFILHPSSLTLQPPPLTEGERSIDAPGGFESGMAARLGRGILAMLGGEGNPNHATDGKFAAGGGGTHHAPDRIKKTWRGGDITQHIRRQSEGGKIVITGHEFAGAQDEHDVREMAKSYAMQHLRNRPFENPEIGPVHISRTGINKVIANTADIRRAKIVPAIPLMIERGTRVGPPTPGDDHSVYDEYQRFQTSVEIDGKEEPVMFLLGKDKFGNWYYNHDIAEAK